MNRRRIAALATTCGLLLAGAAIPAVAAGASGPETAPVRIVTYNAQYGRSAATVANDVKRLVAARAAVIGLQEMGSPDRRAAVLAEVVTCATCRYDAFMPTTREQNAVPILYKRAKFTLLGNGGKKVSERTYVGDSGAGPSTLKAKWVNWVLLRHNVTGKRMYVLNSHAVPSVQGTGGGRNLDHPERLELYRQHMEGLKALITEFTATGAAVFSTGDFNVAYRSDSVVRDRYFPYYNMNAVRVDASYRVLGLPELGTHTSGTRARHIDYVFALRHSAVTAKEQSVMTGFTSDHRPLMVRYAIDR